MRRVSWNTEDDGVNEDDHDDDNKADDESDGDEDASDLADCSDRDSDWEPKPKDASSSCTESSLEEEVDEMEDLTREVPRRFHPPQDRASLTAAPSLCSLCGEMASDLSTHLRDHHRIFTTDLGPAATESDRGGEGGRGEPVDDVELHLMERQPVSPSAQDDSTYQLCHLCGSMVSTADMPRHMEVAHQELRVSEESSTPPQSPSKSRLLERCSRRSTRKRFRSLSPKQEAGSVIGDMDTEQSVQMPPQKKRKKGGNNVKLKCPHCPETRAAMTHLPRHIEKYHFVDKREAHRLGTLRCNPNLVRETPAPSTNPVTAADTSATPNSQGPVVKKKSIRHARLCPFPYCDAWTTNLTDHFKKIKRHREDIKTPEDHQNWLRKAREVKTPEEAAAATANKADSKEEVLEATIADLEKYMRADKLISVHDETPKNMKQLLTRVRGMLRVLPDDGSLFNPVYFKTEVIDEMEKENKGPDSISAACNAVSAFAKYHCEVRQTLTESAYQRFKERMNAFARFYKGEANQNRQKRLDEESDGENEVNTDDVSALLDSGYWKETEKMLRDPATVVTRTNYCRTRNLILCKFVTLSAQRSAATVNMTIGNARRCFSKKPDKDGCTAVKVPKHKTKKRFGSVVLPLDKDLVDDLRQWYEHFRPRVLGSSVTCATQLKDEEPFFKAWSLHEGHSDSSLMSKIMTLIMQQGTSSTKKWTNNRYRSLTVTEIAQHRPDLRESAALMMTHDVETAKRNYFRKDKERNAIDMLKTMKLLRSGQLSKSQAAERPGTSTPSFDASLATSSKQVEDSDSEDQMSCPEQDSDEDDGSPAGRKDTDDFMPQAFTPPPAPISDAAPKKRPGKKYRNSTARKCGAVSQKAGPGRRAGQRNFTAATKAAVMAKYRSEIGRGQRVSKETIADDIDGDSAFARSVSNLTATQIYNMIGTLKAARDRKPVKKFDESDSDSD